SITTNNGNFTANNTINGAQNLTIAAGTGTVTFNGHVGASLALTALTASAANINTSAGTNITSDGAVSLTASTANSIGGNISTTSDAIIITVNTTLTTNV
ncbi:MAG: hypothetical protein ACK6EB_40550, partial [Planctomyces sp.]